jgi:hypothetical protein
MIEPAVLWGPTVLRLFIYAYMHTTCKSNVKLSLYQAVEAHRVLRGRGSHIF